MKKGFTVFPVLSGIMWGSVGVFVRVLLDEGMNNFTVLSSRVAVASIVILIAILIYNKELLIIKIKEVWVFCAGGVFGMLGLNLCYNEGIQQLTLSLSAVLLSLSPVFVMLLSTVFFKEKITVKKILCSIMAIIGCCFVSGFLDEGVNVLFHASGILIGTCAALFYALYSVFSKFAMDMGYNVFTITFYNTLITAIVLVPFTKWGVIAEYVVETPVKSVFFLILYAVSTSILPYILYTVALTGIDTGKSAILAAGCEPAAAMIFGIVFFKEEPTLFMLIGLVLTIGAIAFMSMSEKKKKY